MVEPTDLAAARRGYVIAAAGCGKTELISEAAASRPDRRSLILTHTHAGVAALRSRLREKGLGHRQCNVETITGFALRFAAAYPKTSRWDGDKPTGPGWNAVQEGAGRVIDTRAGREVLAASYPGGIYVDEYQDCTAVQHQLVTTLADVLPTRILGDPLQGIFGFAGKTVDWDAVKMEFEDVGSLSTPHRWSNTNRDLGEWLIDARERLLRGDQPDWTSPVVKVEASTDARQVMACNRFRDVDSVVAIRKWAADEQNVASRLGGAFTSMEIIDSKDLIDAARRFGEAQGMDLAYLTIDFAARCMTNVGSHLRTARDRLRNGELPTARLGSANEDCVKALCTVANSGISGVAKALDAISALPDVRVYRHELLDETKRALRLRTPGSESSLEDIAWQLRDDARRRGRKVPARVVSRTLLIKGLEFDHALVLKAKELSKEELYVAITRPRYTLTVLR